MDNNTKTPQQLEEEKKARTNEQDTSKTESASKADQKPPVTEPKKS